MSATQNPGTIRTAESTTGTANHQMNAADEDTRNAVTTIRDLSDRTLAAQRHDFFFLPLLRTVRTVSGRGSAETW
jgi:hypothetical protein